MTAKKHPAINTFKVLDKFRVQAFNQALERFFVFQVVGPRGTRPPEFNCHIYDSCLLNYPGYVETGTVGTDNATLSGSQIRSNGTGHTLEDLVHNLDWAHLPSELAQLRALLSTRVTTDTGTLVGDMVIRRLTDAEFETQQSVRRKRADEAISKQAEELSQLALSAVSQAADTARAAARFGLRQDMQVSFGNQPLQ